MSAQSDFLVADDLSGALDAAGAFHRAGRRVTTVLDARSWPPAGGDEVVAVTTETRNAPPAVAAAAVAGAIARGREEGRRLVYKKIDSTLRGPVAAELAALAAALPDRRILFAPANPAAGRIVRDGVLLVHGVPVAATAFGRDPTSPVRESAIRRLLADVAPGRIIIPDAETAGDLAAAVAQMEASGHPWVAVGSGALALPVASQLYGDTRLARLAAERGQRPARSAEGAFGRGDGEGEAAQPPGGPREKESEAGQPPGLALREPSTATQAGEVSKAGDAGEAADNTAQAKGESGPPTGQGAAKIGNRRVSGPFRAVCLMVCGSAHGLNRAQAEVLTRERNVRVHELRLAAPDLAAAAALGDLQAGRSAGLMIEQQRQEGRGVVQTIVASVVRILAKTQTDRLFVTGGETAFALCTALEISTLAFWEEIEPGLSLSQGETAQGALLFAIKPGGFGDAQTWVRAWDALKAI